MQLKHWYVFILITGIFLFPACELFDASEGGIPSYVKIDEITLESKSGEGSSSSRIKDAWVYIGNYNNLFS